jgi:hypothetical protein
MLAQHSQKEGIAVIMEKIVTCTNLVVRIIAQLMHCVDVMIMTNSLTKEKKNIASVQWIDSVHVVI